MRSFKRDQISHVFRQLCVHEFETGELVNSSVRMSYIYGRGIYEYQRGVAVEVLRTTKQMQRGR